MLMVFGVVVQALGLSLLLKIDLGTDPYSSFTTGLMNWLPIGFGTIQFIGHLVNFAIVVAFDLRKVGWGTIGNMVCLGYIADFFTFIWDRFLPADFFQMAAVRYIGLIPVLIIFIVGVASYITADLGVSPYDGVPSILHEKLKKFSYRNVRMAWDIGFMILGFLLGGAVGAVTIVTSFFLGPELHFFKRSLK